MTGDKIRRKVNIIFDDDVGADVKNDRSAAAEIRKMVRPGIKKVRSETLFMMYTIHLCGRLHTATYHTHNKSVYVRQWPDYATARRSQFHVV
jgi:hypothetical protein